MEKGYIKLSRKFFENKIWQAARAFNEGEAWLDLIQLARFETSEITSRIGVHEITWGKMCIRDSYLSSLTSIPEGFNPTVGSSLYLSSLTSIPEGFNPTVVGSLDLCSLTSRCV